MYHREWGWSFLWPQCSAVKALKVLKGMLLVFNPQLGIRKLYSRCFITI